MGWYILLFNSHSSIGTDIFTITCIIPEIESIGIADDLRKETSGSVNHPQLFFDSWCLFDENPYYKPTTREEIEEWGDSVWDSLPCSCLVEYNQSFSSYCG